MDFELDEPDTRRRDTALLESFPVHRVIRDIHVHSTHTNLYNTAESIGRSCMGLDFDSAQQQ
jgi:hypothetical protein